MQVCRRLRAQQETPLSWEFGRTSKWKTRGAPAHGITLPFPWICPDSCRMDPAGPFLAQVGVLSPQAVFMSHWWGHHPFLLLFQKHLEYQDEDEAPAWKALPA